MALGFSTLNHSPMFGQDTALIEQVRVAAAAGFELLAIDIFSLRATIADGAMGELAELIDEVGIDVLDVCALSMSTDAETWTAELGELLGAARMLRPRHVMVRVDGPVDTGAIERIRRTAMELANIGVGVVLEPSPLSGVPSLVRGGELLAEVGVDECGLVADSWHFFVSEAPWSELIATVPHIAYVQIADGVPPNGADLMDQTLHHRRQPGDGQFDLARFVTTLTDAGYRGPWCGEVLDDASRRRPVTHFAVHCHARLTALCAGADTPD